MNLLLEFFVFLVVRIVALVLVSSELGHEFLLYAAVLLDLLVGELDGSEHHFFADLVHLAFDHHDVLFGCGDHEFEICLLHLGESRVDAVLSVDPADSDFRDRASEWKVGGGEGT